MTVVIGIVNAVLALVWVFVASTLVMDAVRNRSTVDPVAFALVISVMLATVAVLAVQAWRCLV